MPSVSGFSLLADIWKGTAGPRGKCVWQVNFHSFIEHDLFHGRGGSMWFSKASVLFHMGYKVPDLVRETFSLPF